MTFGGTTFSGVPFAAIDLGSGEYQVYIDLEILFPVSLVFFGEIGDVIILPPDLDLPPVNLNDRLSPCILFDN